MTGLQHINKAGTDSQTFLDSLPVYANTGMTWAIQGGFAIIGVFTVVTILRFLLMRGTD